MICLETNSLKHTHSYTFIHPHTHTQSPKQMRDAASSHIRVCVCRMKDEMVFFVLIKAKTLKLFLNFSLRPNLNWIFFFTVTCLIPAITVDSHSGADIFCPGHRAVHSSDRTPGNEDTHRGFSASGPFSTPGSWITLCPACCLGPVCLRRLHHGQTAQTASVWGCINVLTPPRTTTTTMRWGSRSSSPTNRP